MKNKYIIITIVIVILAVLFVVGYSVKKVTNVENNTQTPGITNPYMEGGNSSPLETTNPNPPIDNTKEVINNTNITNDDKIMHATIKTSKGDISIEFSPTTAPKTVENFKKLASDGFYAGIKFHRVIKGFMIQAGDPLTKDNAKMDMWGTGGPGYKFADELSGSEQYTQGTVAMANSGPNTNGSQFFIVTASPSAGLPPSYTVFGHVTKGMDVALSIENVATDSHDKPLEAVVIKSITLE